MHHVKFIIRVDLSQVVLIPLPLQILLVLNIPVRRVIGAVDLCSKVGDAYD